MTTKTNGVSFELVAGAIVHVAFSNNGGALTSWTLNINSTGAKTVTWYSKAMNMTYRHNRDNQDFKFTITGLFLYNGSKYYTVPGFAYGDYSDES